MLSHPTALGTVSLYVPDIVQTFPLGEVKSLQLLMLLVLCVLGNIVKFTVIKLSHPAALAIVSR